MSVHLSIGALVPFKLTEIVAEVPEGIVGGKIPRKVQQRSKVLVGGRDKPEDEYVAKLSYGSDDINNYRKKFDMLLSSGVEFK